MSPRLKHTCDDNQIQTLCLMQSINFTAVRQVNFVIALMEGCPSFRASFFFYPSLPLSHQRDVDTVSGGDGSKRDEPSNQGRDVLQQERGDIKQEGGI